MSTGLKAISDKLTELGVDMRQIKDQVSQILTNHGRLDERMTSHAREVEQVKGDVDNLWNAHREHSARLGTLETASAVSGTKENARGSLVQNVVYPVVVGVLVLALGYLFTTRPAGGEDAPAHHEAPAQ
jgi:hypothetical protein